MGNVMCDALDMENVTVEARLPRLIVTFGMPARFILTRS